MSIQKLKLLWRRYRLGTAYKHMAKCDPRFDIKRGDKRHEIIWNKQKIATVGNVSTLKKQFSADCFIVASGPSLNEIDFKRLAGYDTLSLNCAIKRFNSEGIRPTHAVIVDQRVFENNWDCIKDSILSGANCFFSFTGLSRICEREPALLNNDNIYLVEGISRFYGQPRSDLGTFTQAHANEPDFFTDATLPTRGVIGFSSDIEKGFFSGKTVATWAVQLAYGLGYQQQFIIGMDLGGTGKAHFYAREANKAPDFLADYEPFIRASFQQARRAADQIGFAIYNLSEHSTLPDEIIPKISYDTAIKIARTKAES